MKYTVTVRVTTKGKVTKKYIRAVMKTLERGGRIEKIVVPVIQEVGK